MLWEELTASEFEQAKEAAKGVCLLPIGVVEKHGQHLPLGTDMYMCRWLGEEIAKVEPSVVFPYYFFGQIAEARHVPGTVALRPDLMYSLLEEVCSEISRNGFKKIVLLDGHGGNGPFLHSFVQNTLYAKKDYNTYVIRLLPSEEGFKEIKEMLNQADLGSHGGNSETSRIMAIRPDLVKMDQVEQEGLKTYGMLNHLKDIYTAMGWYSNHPTHFAGEPYHARPDVGKRMLELIIERVAHLVKIIKEDSMAKQLQDEFFEKSCDLLNYICETT